MHNDVAFILNHNLNNIVTRSGVSSTIYVVLSIVSNAELCETIISKLYNSDITAHDDITTYFKGTMR